MRHLLNTPSQHAPWPGDLDLYFTLQWLSFSHQPCAISQTIRPTTIKPCMKHLLDILTHHAPWAGDLDLYFKLLWLCPSKCDTPFRRFLVSSGTTCMFANGVQVTTKMAKKIKMCISWREINDNGIRMGIAFLKFVSWWGTSDDQNVFRQGQYYWNLNGCMFTCWPWSILYIFFFHCDIAKNSEFIGIFQRSVIENRLSSYLSQ